MGQNQSNFCSTFSRSSQMNVEDSKYQHFLNVLPGYSAGGGSRNPLAGLRLFFMYVGGGRKMHKELRRCLKRYPMMQTELEDAHAALTELDNIGPNTSRLSVARADAGGVSSPVEREAVRREQERKRLKEQIHDLLIPISTIDLGLRFLTDEQKRLIRKVYFAGSKLPKHRRKEHKQALDILANITRIYDPWDVET